MNYRFPALLAATGAAILSFSSPADAALVVNPNGSITVSGAAGGSTTINLDGFGGDPAVVIPGLTSTLKITFNGFSGNTATFSYEVANTSSAPITASRVSIFGFNTNPDISGGSATGTFASVNAGSGNVPNFGNVEVCFGGSNCAGGGGGGVNLGSTGTGTFTLNFGSALTELTLSNFYVRYQSIAGAGNTTSAIGRQTPPVPEPGTWAMMLVGFGAVGFAMRRGRKIRAQFKGGLPQLA